MGAGQPGEKRKRGYDQSALLCREIGTQLRLEPIQTLRKIRTRPRSPRLRTPPSGANVSGAYRAEQPERFAESAF